MSKSYNYICVICHKTKEMITPITVAVNLSEQIC